MKAMLFIREQGLVKFVQENGTFEDTQEADVRNYGIHTDELGEAKAYAKGVQMCRDGSVEEFQVWTLSGHYKRETSIEIKDA